MGFRVVSDLSFLVFVWCALGVCNMSVGFLGFWALGFWLRVPSCGLWINIKVGVQSSLA